jgi:hypothetical protein
MFSISDNIGAYRPNRDALNVTFCQSKLGETGSSSMTIVADFRAGKGTGGRAYSRDANKTSNPAIGCPSRGCNPIGLSGRASRA